MRNLRSLIHWKRDRMRWTEFYPATPFQLVVIKSLGIFM